MIKADFQIEDLQRRVNDLSTMNEMLLEQNAQYRQNVRTSQANLSLNGSIQPNTGLNTGSIHQGSIHQPVAVPAVQVAQVNNVS